MVSLGVVVPDKKQHPERLLAHKLKPSSKPKKHPKNATEKSCSPPNNQQLIKLARFTTAILRSNEVAKMINIKTTVL